MYHYFFSITVDTFAENDLRTFPLITFCPLMKDVIQLVDEETTFQDVLDQSPSRDLIISPKADEPMLVGKWTKTFKFFSHPKYGSRRLVQACFTYDHGQNVKVGSYEDHVSTFLNRLFLVALGSVLNLRLCQKIPAVCPGGFEPSENGFSHRLSHFQKMLMLRKLTFLKDFASILLLHLAFLPYCQNANHLLRKLSFFSAHVYAPNERCGRDGFDST